MYQTTREVLQKRFQVPDDRPAGFVQKRMDPSKLYAMFSDPATELCPLDAQGNFFIDRDGQLFRYILNYLRTGRVLLPKDTDELQFLQLEADYFKIPSMSKAIINAKLAGSNRQTIQPVRVMNKFN